MTSTMPWRKIEDEYEIRRQRRAYVDRPWGPVYWEGTFAPVAPSAGIAPLFVSANTSSIATWLTEALEELAAVASLPEGWNGYNERRVAEQAYRSAVELLVTSALSRVRSRPAVSPLASGGVQFDWGPDGELVVEIDELGNRLAFWSGDAVSASDEWSVTGPAEVQILFAYADRFS